MKIGIFLSSLGWIRGGLETTSAQFARGLAARGHSVACVSGAVPGQPLPPDLAALPVGWLRVPCLPPEQFLGPGASPRVRGLHLKVQSRTFITACRAHRAVRRLIATADVTLSFLEVETVLLSGWRAQHRRPHVSCFPGAIDRSWLDRDRSTLRLANSQVTAQAARREGVRVDGVVTPGIDARWLASPYELRSLATTLLFTGRLEANKGIWELLAIFESLVSRRDELRLRLVGDGPLRPALKQEVRRGGLEARVTLVGAVPSEQVLAELGRADMFLFPSHYESFGIAVVEAQAAGPPVLCSDLPVLREITGDGAYLLPARTVAPWVEAAEKLLADEGARLRLVQAARKNARHYTWARSVEKLERYLLQAQQGWEGG